MSMTIYTYDSDWFTIRLVALRDENIKTTTGLGFEVMETADCANRTDSENHTSLTLF